MIAIRIVLFFLIIITVKFIFIYINDGEDKKIIRMKEFIDFTEYVRIYSCDMKMSLEEILSKYSFRSKEMEAVALELSEQIKRKAVMQYDRQEYPKFIEKTIMTPKSYNEIFAEIIYYYGNTFSDVLNKKLLFTKSELEEAMKEFETAYKERKLLLNKISLLAGCLTAIILI